MIRFLFWNINRKPLQHRLARLARYHDVDVVALAECVLSPAEVLASLNGGAGEPYRETMSLLDTIAVYTRLPRQALHTIQDDPASRITIRRVDKGRQKDFLLVVAHFPSKLYWSNESQVQPCAELAHVIRRWEERLGHSRTVLLGDLNMNPFETGIVASYGLHATMARSVADREMRTVLGREYPFFYNPMWGHFGDALDGPPGTYYDSRAEAVTYFWNVFDQVLIRPSLLGAFRNETLKILDTDGAESLRTAGGLPDHSSGSDHLPIIFELDL